MGLRNYFREGNSFAGDRYLTTFFHGEGKPGKCYNTTCMFCTRGKGGDER